MAIQPSLNGAIALVKDPSQRVAFDTWPDIQDQKSANWTMIPIIGRSEPIPMYQSSNARAIALSLRLAAGFEKDDDEKKMNERLSFLKSLTYPSKTRGGINVHPPMVWVICGEHLNVKAFAQDISVSYQESPWGHDEEVVTHPFMADVRMKFVVVNDLLHTDSSVRNKGDNYQDAAGAVVPDIRSLR